MANGDIHKKGTLWVSGNKQPFPTMPWDPTKGGNTFQYSGSGNVEIRDTDSNDAYKLRWVEVNKGKQKLLISDRVLVTKISWDDLNAQNLIKGKRITIDGQEYLLRVLTGGNYYRSGTDGYSGGVLPNEWDDFIENNGNYSGLPKPNSTDLGSGPNDNQKNGAHNKIWNWYYIYSWCQDVYRDSSSFRVYRGSSSARRWNCSNSGNRNTKLSWRPVLEVLNAAPTIDGEDIDLGVIKGNSYTKTYNVTEPDGDIFSIEEKVDGELIRRLENQTDGQFTLDLSSKLSSLAYTSHTITITATDSKGASSVRTWTFKRANNPPKAPLVYGLKNDYRINIADFEIEFYPTKDEDGDKQYLTLEVADDADFLQNKYTQNNGLYVQDPIMSTWKETDGCENMEVGSLFKFVCKGKVTADTKEKYIRVGTTDKIAGHPIAWSNHVKVKTCKKLEFSTQPISLDYQPTGANVTINATIDARATTSALVTNNANDPEPVWEDMTQEWKEDKFHTFVNKSQTAGWAVAYKVIVNANDATGEISVSEILMGVR